MSMTAEQEAALRANTTTGDPFDVHSASVAAWRNVWALVDEARAKFSESAALARLPAGHYVFRKKFDDADSDFDAAVLTPDAIDALGDLGVSECAYSMPFADCVKALAHEVKS